MLSEPVGPWLWDFNIQKTKQNKTNENQKTNTYTQDLAAGVSTLEMEKQVGEGKESSPHPLLPPVFRPAGNLSRRPCRRGLVDDMEWE